MQSLTLDLANRIAAGAVAAARAMGIPPVTVVVLDASGHLKSMQREDGASMFRFEIATGKAWAAIGMGAASRVLAERAKGNPNFFVSLAATAQGRFLPQTGAVLILDASGAVLGAAGASGGTGDEDEAISAQGVLDAGLTPG
jgi:uncharacterized protein GlcG (DUF336 family)